MIITLIIVGLLIVVLWYLGYSARKDMVNTPLVADHKKIANLTFQTFEQQTNNKVMLVDFWAAWCVPCRIMAPILNEIAEELTDSQQVGKVNIEDCQPLAQKFKVRSIPTIILLKNGVEVNRFVGVKSKEFLLQQIRSI